MRLHDWKTIILNKGIIPISRAYNSEDVAKLESVVKNMRLKKT